ASAGDYVLAARMVRDGVAWFGDTFRKTIHVEAGGGTPDGGGGGGSGGTPGDGSGGTPGDGSGGAGGGNPEAGGAPVPHHGCSIAADLGSGVTARSTGGDATFPALVSVSLLALFRRREKPLV